MLWMKEIFREIKIRGHLDELKQLPSVKERIQRLDQIVIQVNISKEKLSFYSPDERLYLLYKIQEQGIDMGLCPHFYIFYSKRNRCFHYVCKATEKERTYCRGRTKCCDKGIF